MDHPDQDQDLQFNAPTLEELQPLFPAYEIGGFIAQGGMGAVYAARQLSLDRPVAIKILPRKFGADPQFRASFAAEAKSMARLNHPNLIGVYDFGDVDGMLYIIMELVEGKSLHHSAHGKRIDQSEVARLVAGISHGLAHAHQAGILHRDIKPGNILLGPGAQPKIGDFGLARPVGQEHNPDEIVWGTPGYSAPEVVNDPDAVDQRADIFAVGVLLYELLTAQVPPEPWQPPSRIAGCNPAFDTIIRRATHPSPSMRYGSAEEIANELDSLAKKLESGVVHRPTIPTSPTGIPSLSVGGRPIAPAVSGSKSKAGTILLALGGLAILAVGAIIVSSSLSEDATSGRSGEQPPVAPSEQPAPKPQPKPKPTVVENPRPKSSSLEDKPPANPSATPEPPKPKPEESPTQALARLRNQLKSGDLSEFPKGVAQRGQSHFYLVEKPLDWQSASHFAEDHGAQLAVLDSAESLAWASGQFKAKSPLWIGLSDSGMESKWNWVSGDPVEKALWAPGQPDDTPSPDDGEDFAVLLPSGTLDDFPASRRLPFLLHWSGKSGNEGSLSKQLLRAGKALKEKRAPVFPAGTRNIGGSRFLLVPRSTTWEEASAMAQAAGGHLAVPSSQAEADWIRNSLQKTLGGGDGCWIGGQLRGSASKQWTFVTGERFNFITWAPGGPQADENLDRLRLWRNVDGQFGYSNAAGEAKDSNYFLVEWSVPSRRNMPSEAELKLQAATAEDWLTALRQKTSNQEQAAFERWKRRHQKNVKDFVDDIDSETETARNFSREAKNFVEAFTKQVEEAGRVPKDVGPGPAQRFIGNIHEKALSKQTKIWDEYERAFLLAQERYLAELKVELKRRLSSGDREGALFLNGELEAAAEKNYFLDLLSGEFPIPPPPENGLDDGDDPEARDR